MQPAAIHSLLTALQNTHTHIQASVFACSGACIVVKVGHVLCRGRGTLGRACHVYEYVFDLLAALGRPDKGQPQLHRLPLPRHLQCHSQSVEGRYVSSVDGQTDVVLHHGHIGVAVVRVHVSGNGTRERHDVVRLGRQVLRRIDVAHPRKSADKAQADHLVHSIPLEVAEVDPVCFWVFPKKGLLQRGRLIGRHACHGANQTHTAVRQTLKVSSPDGHCCLLVLDQILSVCGEAGEAEDGPALLVDGELHHSAAGVALEVTRYGRYGRVSVCVFDERPCLLCRRQEGGCLLVLHDFLLQFHLLSGDLRLLRHSVSAPSARTQTVLLLLLLLLFGRRSIGRRRCAARQHRPGRVHSRSCHEGAGALRCRPALRPEMQPRPINHSTLDAWTGHDGSQRVAEGRCPHS
mmetsp:Transcript_14466/g.34515  ORF Transcript_14466/g.34515 Transcript_14466/m.34515 type:complete len:405 (-) Transcript_14466:245-1459(-)